MRPIDLLLRALVAGKSPQSCEILCCCAAGSPVIHLRHSGLRRLSIRDAKLLLRNKGPRSLHNHVKTNLGLANPVWRVISHTGSTMLKLSQR